MIRWEWRDRAILWVIIVFAVANLVASLLLLGGFTL